MTFTSNENPDTFIGWRDLIQFHVGLFLVGIVLSTVLLEVARVVWFAVPELSCRVTTQLPRIGFTKLSQRRSQMIIVPVFKLISKSRKQHVSLSSISVKKGQKKIARCKIFVEAEEPLFARRATWAKLRVKFPWPFTCGPRIGFTFHNRESSFGPLPA